MKVLIVAQYFPPDMGGGATRAYNMAKGLMLAGCDVTVVTAFPHYPTGNIPKKYSNKLLSIETEGHLRIIRTFVPPLASEGIAKRICLFVAFIFSSLCALPAVGKVDVIWASNPNIIAMIPSLWYKLFNNCNVVQNIDDLWPEALYDLGMNKQSLKAKIAELIAKVTYHYASVLTPISPAYVPILTEKYAVLPEKIHVVVAGVDLSIFPEKNIVKDSNNLFQVLYIGAFSPAYDFDQIFKAAELLVENQNIAFVIQGGGELGPELKRKVKTSGLKNITIIEKIVNRNEVVQIMARANALLLPLNGIGSIEMGISSKLYEYQAIGKPILCCSRGQPGLYILKTKSGIVIEPGDSKALCKSILFLKENPSKANELGLSGRSYVEQNLSIEKIGLSMKKIFLTIK